MLFLCKLLEKRHKMIWKQVNRGFWTIGKYCVTVATNLCSFPIENSSFHLRWSLWYWIRRLDPILLNFIRWWWRLAAATGVSGVLRSSLIIILVDLVLLGVFNESDWLLQCLILGKTCVCPVFAVIFTVYGISGMEGLFYQRVLSRGLDL